MVLIGESLKFGTRDVCWLMIGLFTCDLLVGEQPVEVLKRQQSVNGLNVNDGGKIQFI